MTEGTEATKGSHIHRGRGDLSVLYVTTFPPRKCGIATFTQDLTNAMDEMLAPAIQSKIMALNPNDVMGYHYPKKVILQLTQDNERDYVEMARKINRMDEVRLVSIQHEFGIYGGERGSYLVPFTRALRKPSVINFHTVLPDPDDNLRDLVRRIAENVNAITVMTRMSKKILAQDYGISDRKITIIAHGIHSHPFTSSRQAKMALGFSGKIVMSTFGLLNRGKGLEYVIEALPEVVKRYPDFVYIYFGATHPFILREEGESYRNELIERIYQLGLFEHVRFYNKFFPLGELLRFLKATDIYISTVLDPNQAVSGTLSYALGTGRPVISTAFANARELITDDIGILVDFRNPQAYTEAILSLLEDEERRAQMGSNAYFRTRRMIWPNVAVQQAKLFSQHARSLARVSEKKSLPKIKLDHLLHLTDSFGIVQFARLNRPDVRYGYTLDDNARALMAAALCYGKLGRASRNPTVAKQKRELLRLVNTYLDFVLVTAHPDGRFQNYVKADRTLDDIRNQQTNLDDANGRTLHALAITATTGSLPKSVRQKARDLIERVTRQGVTLESPRAVAHWIKALCVLIRKGVEVEGIDLRGLLTEQCDRLVSLYKVSSSPDWEWYEGYLTYSNAVLPEALVMAYRVTGEDEYLRAGKTTLDFLVDMTFIDGVYSPVGQDGWHQKNGRRNQYDQQPEEVTSMVCALNVCHAVTKDERYSDLMHTAFYWFLGDNSLKQVVYDRTTGGCYDGVGKKAVNLNEGAESTVSYLLARLAFE